MPCLRPAAAILAALALSALPRPAAAADRGAGAPFPLIDTRIGLTPHKEVYVLPYTYAEAYDGEQAEVIFSLSAKHDLFGSRFYFGYTQISFWQAYDIDGSSPFRDTNYNPELFYRFEQQPLEGGWSGADAGIEHESNGQRVPLSRSWNLLYVAPYYRADRWLAYAKLRYRIPERAKETPGAGEGDDNPDITDYLGWTDVHLYAKPWRGHLAHVLVRGFFGTGKGNASLNYSFPLTGDDDTWFVVRLFHGYGESMLDYDRKLSRVGFGLMFNR